MTGSPLQFQNVRLPGLEHGELTMDIQSHAATAIVGAEASGVDGLGRFALALRVPPSGRVLVYGDDVARMPPTEALAFRRRVGYLPAGDGLLHNLSLRDNIALPLRFGSSLSEHEIEGRLRVMLAQLHLLDSADRRPADVTAELRRRAAVARALAFDPQLVILEDPFDGLTTRTSAELLGIIRGGETDEGSRRTVFIIGQSLPHALETRIEIRYRITRGTINREN